jgi:hypothetical protein
MEVLANLMSHEMSKKHADQVAEKAAIIANTAFLLGRKAERQHIIELMMNQPVSEELHKVIELLREETTSDGSN